MSENTHMLTFALMEVSVFQTDPMMFTKWSFTKGQKVSIELVKYI